MRHTSYSIGRINPLVLFIAALVVLSALTMAYGTGGPPSFLGHTSEEVQFTIGFAQQNCTGGTSSICTATCPAPLSGGVNYAISGYCLVTSPIGNLRGAGIAGINSWSCTEPNYAVATQFIAVVNCLDSGPTQAGS